MTVESTTSITFTGCICIDYANTSRGKVNAWHFQFKLPFVVTIVMGVTPSHSRPRVSNDNPFSESLFRTLKYRPQWPSSGFNNLDDARSWVKNFVEWYNEEHRHSRIGFVNPGQYHRNEDNEILANRKTVFERAKVRNPERWSGKIRKCEPAGPVMLNPEKPEISEQLEQAA